MLRLNRHFFPLAFVLAAGLVISASASTQTPAQAPAQVPSQTPSATPSSGTPAAASTLSPNQADQADPEAVGDAFSAHQRYQAAIAAYSKAPKMTAQIWNKLGISYQMMLNFNQALLCYQKSIKLNPTDSQVLNNLATVYGSMKNYGAADRMYRKAIKLDPQSALVLKNYGTNLMTEHKYTKGWEAYQRALAVDPTIFSGHNGPTVQNVASVGDRGAMNYYMALGCARAGYTDCALEYLRSAIDEGYTNPKKVAADDAFASLRGNPAFQQLLSEQRRQ